VKSKIVWAHTVWELFLKLPDRDRDEILERLAFVELFPHIYPVRTRSRRFRRHRWFHVGNWLLYYRVVDNTIYIRGLRPARIP
jgi:mRNA-degrading endonuclease RelE of RelBE toxin-antitoxin system